VRRAVRAVDVDWRILCYRERERRDHVRSIAPGSAEFRAALRNWRASVEALLTGHVRAVAAGSTIETIPLEILEAFRGFAGYLAVGQIPGPIADVSTEGRRATGPTERRDIGLAVAYLKAAKGGIEHHGEQIVVDDSAPVKTVCEAFGVERPTVQGWHRNVQVALLGINPVSAELLVELIKNAGERYRGSGRSSAAIDERGCN
jgi:hypothetical protein